MDQRPNSASGAVHRPMTSRFVLRGASGPQGLARGSWYVWALGSLATYHSWFVVQVAAQGDVGKTLCLQHRAEFTAQLFVYFEVESATRMQEFQCRVGYRLIKDERSLVCYEESSMRFMVANIDVHGHDVACRNIGRVADNAVKFADSLGGLFHGVHHHNGPLTGQLGAADILPADTIMPSRIPIIMGLVRMPFMEAFRELLFSPWEEEPVKDKINTAAMLYKGTVPIIIKGAMPELP